MSVLVTGGAGYIGSHTCVELLNADYDVIVLDNFSNSNTEALRRVEKITGKHLKTYKADLLDKQRITTIFEKNSIDAVVHFAGLKAVGESVSSPLRYYENNIAGTINLCNVMRTFGVKQLVFSSSATVYGATDNVPIAEDAEWNASNPYGRTKQMIEELLHDLYDSDQAWSIALLRYFNPVGAHQSGYIGEDPNGTPSNLMPYISQVAIGKRQRLEVFGSDYPTEDGTGVRDYIHVVDLAKGHVKALDKVQSTSGIDAYNLGTGIGYSVLEIVAAFEKASNQKIPYSLANRRPGDTAISYANPEKAKDQLGWQAMKGIDAMCGDVWRWQSNNPDGYDTSIEQHTESDTPMHIAAGFLVSEKVLRE